MIRPAEEKDRATIQVLLRACALPNDMAWFPAQALVADDLSGVAGYEIHGDSALLRSVAVAPVARRHGLARDLVTAVLQRLSGRDVYLLTETAADYFPRFGFTRIERATAPDAIKTSPQFSILCPASAVLMHRRA